MSFYNVLEYKTILKSCKTWNFRENSSKIALLALKWAKRPPGPHWDPPGPWKRFFFWVARIWKPYARKKNFWVISHRKKVGVTISGKNRTKFKNPPNSQKNRAHTLSPAINFFYGPKPSFCKRLDNCNPKCSFFWLFPLLNGQHRISIYVCYCDRCLLVKTVI